MDVVHPTGADGGRDDERSVLDIVEGAGADDARVLVLTGEIDLSSVAELQATVQRLLDAGPTSIVFDLAGVSFIDSTGIAVLIDAADRARNVGLRNPSPAVATVVELSGLGPILPVIA